MEQFLTKSGQRSLYYAIGLIAACGLISILIFKTGVAGGIMAVGGIGAMLLVLLVFNNYRDGFLLIVFYSFFMFHIYRIIPPSMAGIPVGVGVDLLLVLVLLSVLVHKQRPGEKLESSSYKNPVIYAFMIFLGYTMLLLLHPSSRSVLGRVVAVREMIMLVTSLLIVLHVFRTDKMIKFFLKFWIFFATLAALYGIYQEIFGLQDWELRWLNSNPETAKLAFIWGHYRKWSFLSDINAFGLFMSYAGIVCIVLALGPFSILKRAVLASAGCLMLVSMTYSGTRTAMAMVVFGFLFYVVISLHKLSTLVVAFVFTACFLGIYFGPFYGGTFSRIRSTVNVSEDASMNVRKSTRSRMQPYIQAHPFGGGLNTAGHVGLQNEPDHTLAGQWDPDSGYLKTALERGYIGLLIQLGLYATILIFGIINYFKTTDPSIKIIYCAYLCGFFALSIANFAQDSMEQKPVNLILMGSIASMIALSTLKKEQTR
jgi:putative inorganic carbon (HCO3(-)) transporter